jgi:hypothetical protein
MATRGTRLSLEFERDSLLRWFDDVILEVAGAISLRPQADLARNWLRQRVFERKLTVDVGFELGPCDRHLQLMPLVAGQVPRLPSGTTPDQFADAIAEGPKRDIVLGIVVARGKPVAVRFDIEQNTGTAVEIARNGLELQADRTV